MNTATVKTFRNVGALDAVLRIAVAMLLLGVVLSLNLDPIQSFLLVALSIPTMLFALMRWDPLYSLSNLNTDGNSLRA